MNACIVKPHHAGLFSLLNNVITCFSLYSHVHVDWSQGCIYGNAWDTLFEPTIHPHQANHKTFHVLSEYPHQALTYKNAGILYQAERLLDWRSACHWLWRKLDLREEINQAADRFISEALQQPFTAIMIRGNGHAGEQLSNRAQTFEDYARAIERSAIGPLFVMSADTESLDWFSGRFDIVTHPGTRRSNSREIQPHLTGPQTPEDARQCLLEVLIASRAVTLIHPVSNMATGALYINPQLGSVYIP